jgi:hypothetical protein
MAAEMKHGPIALIDSDNPYSSKGCISLITIKKFTKFIILFIC